MRIAGLGTDVVECRRIGQLLERHGESFIDRVFTPMEIRACRSHRSSLQGFAAGWAAKVAVLKAVGAGGRRGLRWVDIEILQRESGDPTVRLDGEAKAEALRKRICEIRVSVSHCRTFAVAFAVALGRDDAGPLEGLP